MQSIIDVDFWHECHFTDKQLEATRRADECQYFLYGGSRGPGKSYWLRWYLLRELIRLADKHPGVSVALFCEDYTNLKDRQISKIEVEFPLWLGELRTDKARGLGFHLHDGLGSLLLRNLDDVGKYQSAEFAAIGIDELTKNRVEVFNILRGSLRWPGVEKPKFVAATNPGGIGHGWVKSYWLDKDFPPEMEPIKHEFAFVRALPDDNPHLTRSYWESLETLPYELARAWRYGEWDVFVGQYFPELKRHVHGFTGEPPRGWTFRCIDYGESSASAVYWCRVDSNGCVWVYRELYGPGYTFSALAERIVELSVDSEGRPEQIRYTVAPPDVFARRVNRYGQSNDKPVSGADILNAHGVPCMVAHDDRIAGWSRMREFLQIPPALRVHTEACPHFWRTVPILIHDEKKPEDVDDSGEDHAADAIRYGLSTHHVAGGMYGIGNEMRPYIGRPRKAGAKITGY